MNRDQVLKNELTIDPLTRGYTGMTDDQITASLVFNDRTRIRSMMSAGEILDQIDGGEFAGLTADNKARVDRILGLGAEIIIGPRDNHYALNELRTVFGAGSKTIIKLLQTRGVSISRAEELGLGRVLPGYIAMAKGVA